MTSDAQRAVQRAKLKAIAALIGEGLTIPQACDKVGMKRSSFHHLWEHHLPGQPLPQSTRGRPRHIPLDCARIAAIEADVAAGRGNKNHVCRLHGITYDTFCHHKKLCRAAT